MKIAVYSICLNEEKHVDRFMESAVDADFITVADTGSLDHTVENLKTKAIMLGQHRRLAIHDISIMPWRFDLARNTALSLVPADIDVCIRLDLDEALEPGWRAALERAWVPGTTQLWYDFHHTPTYSFRANFIHARHGYIWRGLDHEGLYAATGCTSRIANSTGLSITHHQDHSKLRTAILGRLETQVAEDKRARTLWYLGREYFYYQRNDECVKTFEEYLRQPDAIWASERMDAACMIGQTYFRWRNYERATHWYWRAMAEYHTREPLLGLAQTYMAMGQPKDAMHVINLALNLNNKLTTIHQNQNAWDGTLEKLASKIFTRIVAGPQPVVCDVE